MPGVSHNKKQKRKRIVNPTKRVKIKNKPMEENDDWMITWIFDEERKGLGRDVEIKKEIDINEEPVNIEIENETLDEKNDWNWKIKQEFDEEEGIDRSSDVEMKEEIEIEIKEEPVNVQIENEPFEGEDEDCRFKQEFDKMEGKDTNKDLEMEGDETDNNIENESEENKAKAYISESDFEDNRIEYSYVKSIRKSIDMVSKMGTFSCGGILKKAKMKLSVKGVGEIKLPLSYRQGAVLKSNSCIVDPYGKRSETIVCQYCHNLDKNVAWEVDAKDVTLDMGFKKLIKRKVAEITTTLMEKSFTEKHQVDSVLYKLVYYEKGGHFAAHCVTEKPPGMFATLVIQLPAGHEGGEIVVKHKGETEIFDFEDESRDKFFFTAFFADCEYELRKIIGGHRLVLIYNLIYKTSNSKFHHNIDDNTKPSRIHPSFMSTMNNSVKEWESENKGPQYLALKLDHTYSNTNILFQQLKGKDKNIADALCACKDIKVYLATITKNENHFGDEDDPDIELSYKIHSWTGVKNENPHFGERKLHKNEMLLKEEEMFPENEERCGSEYECTGNEDIDIYYTYKKRALVFFPKSHEILMDCDSNLSLVLAKCKKLSESKNDDALELLKGILFYVEKRHARAMSQLQHSDNVAGIFEIMMLFVDKITCQAKTFLLSLVKPFVTSYLHEGVGLPNINSAVALANLINRFSWVSLGLNVLQLVKECAVSQTESCVQLVNSLLTLKLYEQAISAVWVGISKILGWNVDLSIGDRAFEYFRTFIRIWKEDDWKDLSLKSVILLWPIVLFANQILVDVSLLKKFVQAVIEHEKSSVFLDALLKLPYVVEARNNPLVQLIVEKRLEQLDFPFPVFSWAMPNACGISDKKTLVPGLEKFLRSDEETKAFVGIFENKRKARNFGEKYFGNKTSYQYKNYSARYEIKSLNKRVECKVIKTKDYFDEQVKHYNLITEEAKFLRENFCEPKIVMSRKRACE